MTGLTKDFLYMTPKIQSVKEKTQSIYISTKAENFSSKDTVKRMKWQVTTGGKYFHIKYHIKELYPKIHKELIHSKKKKKNNAMKKYSNT